MVETVRQLKAENEKLSAARLPPQGAGGGRRRGAKTASLEHDNAEVRGSLYSGMDPISEVFAGSGSDSDGIQAAEDCVDEEEGIHYGYGKRKLSLATVEWENDSGRFRIRP